MSLECKNVNTIATSQAIFIHYCNVISYLERWRKLKRHPKGTFSKTIAILGGFVAIPMSKTILGCQRIESILTSFVTSLRSSSVITGSKITFTATSEPHQVPFLITLNPPCPSYSPRVTSERSISLTPEQLILPSDTLLPIDIIEFFEISALSKEISYNNRLLFVLSILSSSYDSCNYFA